MPVGFGQREVLVETIEVTAGVAAHVGAVDAARLLLEAPPVVPAVAAFDLMGGSGRSPQESGGKGLENGAHVFRWISQKLLPIPRARIA